MKWLQLNQEVYGATSNIVSIDFQDVNALKQKVIHCPNKRIRICAHQTADDNLHEMLIVITKGSYIRPHKHLNKSESFHIVEGLLDIIIFDEGGEILEIIPMGDAASGKNFFYRLSTAYFHGLILKTDFVVFHETTQGPWKKEDTVYAPWSPEIGDFFAENQFMKNLENNTKAIIGGL